MTPLSQVMMVLIIGWLMGFALSDDSVSLASSIGKVQSSIWFALIFIVAVSLFYLSAVQASYMPTVEMNYLIQHHLKIELNPRFWSMSRFTPAPL